MADDVFEPKITAFVCNWCTYAGADLTGTSRQMVTAVLNQLKRSNVLYFNRKKILFRDLQSLPAGM